MADIEKGPGACGATGPSNDPHLESEVRAEITAIAVTAQSTSIYFNRRYVGMARSAPSGFWALTDFGENLGLYNALGAAARALVAAAAPRMLGG